MQFTKTWKFGAILAVAFTLGLAQAAYATGNGGQNCNGNGSCAANTTNNAYTTNQGGQGGTGTGIGVGIGYANAQGGQGGNAYAKGGNANAGAAVVGSGNSHNSNVNKLDNTNVSTNVNSNTAKVDNTNLNLQGQQQGQGQKQGQGQGQSQSTDNANNAAQSVTVNGDTVTYEAAKIPVASAYAPANFPTAPCMGSSSGGAQGIRFGFSIGSTWTDEECQILETARNFQEAGLTNDALHVRCQAKYAKAAPSCKAIDSGDESTVASAVAHAETRHTSDRVDVRKANFLGAELY